MYQYPTVFRLGDLLRAERKRARLTQAELAKQAGLSERTVWLLEQSGGNIPSWHAALCALGVELTARHFAASAGPDSQTLGRELATLRRRRGLRLRELAESVGVTPSTLVALELGRGAGKLATLERVLVVLGAGPYLAPHGHSKAFYTHAGNTSTNLTWETPRALLKALSSVFRFDLDPCAARKSRSPVRAKVQFTLDDDGLSLPWHGVVFLNPPYGRTLGLWVAKAHREVHERRADIVVALLPARPDTLYWHEHVAGRAVVYFLRGRLRFSDGLHPAPFPSALVLWGAKPKTITALDKALPDAWRAK